MWATPDFCSDRTVGGLDLVDRGALAARDSAGRVQTLFLLCPPLVGSHCCSNRSNILPVDLCTLHVLERNRAMAKPQNVESFVAQIVLAEFGPACVMSAGGTCHRSGDVPPVLLLHVHNFSTYPAHKRT